MSEITYIQKLKFIRALLKLSQAQFADLIGVTHPTVRKWELEDGSDPNAAARALIDIFFAEPTTACELLEKGKIKGKEIATR